MNTAWLKNDTVSLRAPEPEDLELMYAMENDTTLWSIGNATLPYSRYTLRLYLEQSKQDLFAEHQARFVITLAGGETAGMIDLADFDPLNSRAEVCIGLLGKHRSKGIATQALTLLCEYALKKLHINQLYALIPEWNEESLRLFEKNGFKKSALLKQWLRTENGFKDVFLVQRLSK
ncbi:MAG: GNAT family N-acetyltransferase [Bacteroidaceae bacterium]|nr:GNAT family N-acetyltransferase [Bacteroidaceae bacterium]